MVCANEKIDGESLLSFWGRVAPGRRSVTRVPHAHVTGPQEDSCTPRPRWASLLATLQIRCLPSRGIWCVSLTGSQTPGTPAGCAELRPRAFSFCQFHSVSFAVKNMAMRTPCFHHISPYSRSQSLRVPWGARHTCLIKVCNVQPYSRGYRVWKAVTDARPLQRNLRQRHIVFPHRILFTKLLVTGLYFF